MISETQYLYVNEVDFSGMPSLNILKWYDLFFEEMEATSTLLLKKKKK